MRITYSLKTMDILEILGDDVVIKELDKLSDNPLKVTFIVQ